MVETFSRVTGLKAEYRNAYMREGLLEYFPLLGENPLAADETIGMVEYAVEFGYFRRPRPPVEPTHRSQRADLGAVPPQRRHGAGEPVAFGN